MDEFFLEERTNKEFQKIKNKRKFKKTFKKVLFFPFKVLFKIIIFVFIRLKKIK